MSSLETSRSATSSGKAPATDAPPSNNRSSLTQVSLAQLLGVSNSNISNVTLNMSSAAGSSSNAPAVPDPATEVTLASHERKRAQKRKAPEGPRGRAKSVRTTAESKNIKHNERVNEFPEQGLKVSAGVLFCQPCATTLPNIRNSIVHHLMTAKHKSNLVKHNNRRQADNGLRVELSEYFDANPDEKSVSAHSPCALSRRSFLPSPHSLHRRPH